MVKTGGNPQSIRLYRLFFCELHTLRKYLTKRWKALEMEDMDVMEQMKKIDRDGLIDKFIFELPVLRARIGMTQDEISEIVGISRQTYSSIETRKRKLPWTTYMSLLFVFYFNPDTREPLENAGLFPEDLKKTLNVNHRRAEKWGGA